MRREKFFGQHMTRTESIGTLRTLLQLSSRGRGESRAKRQLKFVLS